MPSSNIAHAVGAAFCVGHVCYKLYLHGHHLVYDGMAG